MKRTITALALTALLTLGGCGGTSGGQDDSNPSGSNASDTSESEAGSEAPEEEAADKSDELKLGETYTYEDGLSVTLADDGLLEIASADREFYPEYLGKGTTNRRFELTIVNKTGGKYDPTMIYAEAQSGNENAEQVFYTGPDGKDRNPSSGAALLDGREGVYELVFNVSDPDDIVIDFSPDAGIEYAPIYFTN